MKWEVALLFVFHSVSVVGANQIGFVPPPHKPDRGFERLRFNPEELPKALCPETIVLNTPIPGQNGSESPTTRPNRRDAKANPVVPPILPSGYGKARSGPSEETAHVT